MDNKEQISTLISVGAGLPPVNPYLDDDDDNNDEDTQLVESPKSKAGRKPSPSSSSTNTRTIAPDPKEYIAELERPEGEDILY